MAGGFRSLLAFWLGGASAPTPPAPVERTPVQPGGNGLTRKGQSHFGGKMPRHGASQGDSFDAQSDTVEALRARAEARRRKDEDEIVVIMRLLIAEDLI